MIHHCPKCGHEWESEIDSDYLWCDQCRSKLWRYWKPKEFL